MEVEEGGGGGIGVEGGEAGEVGEVGHGGEGVGRRGEGGREEEVIYVVGSRWWTCRFFACYWCFGEVHEGCLKGKWVSVVFDRSKRGSRTGNCDLFCCYGKWEYGYKGMRR